LRRFSETSSRIKVGKLMFHSLTPYDQVPYASFPYAQSHPNRLATVATLMGMQPAAIERCRVLELGCASGGNLIPMAAYLPESQFLGVDLSQRQIADGQRTIETLGLKNIELRNQSILDVAPDWGKFDYIVCHGVWSWVPAEVRDKILSICRDNLAPQGVAYISYNCFPGWQMRGAIRDMMLFHARKYETPRDKVGHSRALLDFMVRACHNEKDPYGVFLKSELELLKDKADSYMLHDHLEPVNQPMYFFEFAEQVAGHDLQYLAEADFAMMRADPFSPEVQNILQQLAGNIVEREQYLDFLRNRMFRQTLLCHKEVALDSRLNAARLESLFVLTDLKPAAADSTEKNGETKFASPRGTISTKDPQLSAAFEILAETWPEPIRVGELSDLIQARLNGNGIFDSRRLDQDRLRLSGQLGDCYTRRLVELFVRPPWVARVSQQPRVCELARHQCQASPAITSGKHAMVQLTSMARSITQLADGTRDESTLVAELTRQAQDGKLVVNVNGQRTTDPSQLTAIMTDALKKCLAQFAADGLLVN